MDLAARLFAAMLCSPAFIIFCQELRQLALTYPVTAWCSLLGAFNLIILLFDYQSYIPSCLRLLERILERTLPTSFLRRCGFVVWLEILSAVSMLVI